MGHAPSKETQIQLKGLILDGVVPLNDELGRGAYGVVFTVRYSGKSYAAKKIHTSLTDDVSPEEKEAVKNNFVQECLCCSAIQHPNVVQFLGVYYPKRCDFPVMVMELMSCSLRTFIEKNQSQIDNKVKISILYGISLGLSYLHSRDPQIIHRDLSSNNIMLTDQLIAKIGDLGVAKVIQTDKTKTKSRLTRAPGTKDFMPPEALEGDNIVYGTPVDVFSFGCVSLHLFSEKWPTPGPSKIIDDETNKPVAFTEAERRKKYLDTMNDESIIILKQLVERCLHDVPKSRPTIEEASDLIMLLRLPQLELLDPVEPENTVNNSTTEPLAEFEVTEDSLTFTEALHSDQYHINWTPCTSLPAPLHYASVAVSGPIVYVTGDAPSADTEHNVYSYNTETDCWQQLPQPGHRYGVLCVVGDKLTIFGGRDSATNAMCKKVTTYDSDTKKWISYYPDMLCVRSKPGVITYQDHVIVMGGGCTLYNDHDSIEVMNYHQRQWKEVTARLPTPMYNIIPTISGKCITIVGYSDHARQTASYQVPIKSLITPVDLPSWKKLEQTTHYNTTIIPYSNPPVIIGGETRDFKCTSDIKMFVSFTDSWENVGQLTSPRDSAGVAYISENTIIVIGGTSGGSVTAENCLTTVEKGCIISK